RRHTRCLSDWSSDVCSSDLAIREPLDVEKLQRVLSPAYRALLHDTIAVTRIHGGSCVNCIPSVATANLDVRLLPDETPDAMLAKIGRASCREREEVAEVDGG